MKKSMSVLLSMVLVFSLLTPFVFATGDYHQTVQMIGQWVGESSRKVNTNKVFNAPTDPLGGVEANPGIYRSLAKTFLGWSKTEIVNNQFPEDMVLYHPDETIATVFPEGIPDEAKLYAVYYELNNGPLPSGSDFVAKLKLGTALLNGFSQMKTLMNQNRIVLNQDISAEETLLHTKTASEEDKIKDVTVTDYSRGEGDHILNTDATFKMDPIVNMLVYNRAGILTEQYKNKNNATDFSIEKPDYTYVDLNVDLSSTIETEEGAQGFDIPETLYLEFRSYNWRPIYVLDDKNQMLEITKVDGTSLAGEADPFKLVTSNQTDRVLFKLLTNKSKKLTVRTIIRTPDLVVSPATLIQKEGFVQAALKKDMKLIYDASKEGSQIQVNKAVVKKMIETPGAFKLPLKGSIKGLAVSLPLPRPFGAQKLEINEVFANDNQFSITYVKAKEPKPQPEPKPQLEPKPLPRPKRRVNFREPLLPREKPMNQDTIDSDSQAQSQLNNEKDQVPSTGAFRH